MKKPLFQKISILFTFLLFISINFLFPIRNSSAAENWGYTYGGTTISGFTTEAMCNADILNRFKKTYPASGTGPCIIVAGVSLSTMTPVYLSEAQDFNGLWKWNFKINTTYTPDGTPVKIEILKLQSIISTKTVTITNLTANYDTGFILEEGLSYDYVVRFTLGSNPPIIKEYINSPNSTPTSLPIITSFSPTTGKAGDLVTITGSNLRGVTNIFFGITPASISSSSITNTEIKVVVPVFPVNVSTGKITLRNTMGERVSIQSFSFTTDPTSIDSQQPKDTSLNDYTLLAPIAGLTRVSINDIGDYFNKIFLIAIGLCGALAVIMIVIGGIQYMGDESIFGKTRAKEQMMGAILGLLIALGAYALLKTINPDLLGVGGLNVSQVSAEITEGNQFRLIQTQNTPGAKTFTKTSYFDQIKSISYSNNIPHCLLQVAIQRESGGSPSVGHDEDVPSPNIVSRRDFISSGKKFDGSNFTPGDKNDPKITQSSFKNTDHPSNYLKAPNPSAADLGLDWRFSHSIGMFGVTFGPNHLPTADAKAIYNDQIADITKAVSMMKSFYNKCSQNIDGTWRAYNSGSCTGNNAFTNKETAIRVDLYNQCVAQNP